MKKLSLVIPTEEVKKNIVVSDKGYRNFSFKINLKAEKITTVSGEVIPDAMYQEIEIDGEDPDLFRNGVKVTINIDHAVVCKKVYEGVGYLFFDIVQKSADFIEKNPDFGNFSAIWLNEETDNYEYLKGVFIHNLTSGFGKQSSFSDFFVKKLAPAPADLNDDDKLPF